MCTGGRVVQLQVYENEGGVTKYRGGCRCCIAAAGYLGEAVWGAVLTVCSGGRKTATAAAILLVVSLLACLCYAPNRVLVILNTCYAVLFLVLIYIEWFQYTPILAYCILFVGVFLSTVALMDIFGHLIWRSQPQSDAYTLYEESARCCPPRCIGVTWFLTAVVLQILAVYLTLILSSDQCTEMGWFPCLFHSEFDLDMDAWEWWPFDGDLFRFDK
jgi:hypothetical protein